MFRNFFCSHISIKQRRECGEAAGNGKARCDPWVTVLHNKPLMEDPHYEDDAQDWHTVTAEEFDQEVYDAHSAEPLR